MLHKEPTVGTGYEKNGVSEQQGVGERGARDNHFTAPLPACDWLYLRSRRVGQPRPGAYISPTDHQPLLPCHPASLYVHTHTRAGRFAHALIIFKHRFSAHAHIHTRVERPAWNGREFVRCRHPLMVCSPKPLLLWFLTNYHTITIFTIHGLATK